MKVILLSAILCLIFIQIINASDQVHTAASIDGSPFGFTVINLPIINSNTLVINSNINNTYSGTFSNAWGSNHNFATYVYGGTGPNSSSIFINNSNIFNYSQANNVNDPNFLNFLNVANWTGYNYSNYSQNSLITNNGNITNTIDITNQLRGNFYNYALYSVNVENSSITNNNQLQNFINVQNSNLSNLYNFAISSYDTKVQDNFQNTGTITNQINISNSQITNGVFNYSLHSFFFTNNNLNITYNNQGTITNQAIINNSNVMAQIRNQGIAIVPNNPLNNNTVNITNNSNIFCSLNITNSNTSFLSNDGIVVHNSSIANIINNGNITINTLFDNSFTVIVDSTAGIFLLNVNSGSVINNGLIEVRGTTQNNFTSAGIHIFNSGQTNPIQIQTPNLMILDTNVRNLIINGSQAELLSFGFYVNGDPSSLQYLRPILNFNNSTLSLNNTILHLYIGNDIHLNKPYYIIENHIGSTVNGQFDLNFINHTPISNPNIKVNWFSNIGQNSSIIFTIDPRLSLHNYSRQTFFITSKNISDVLRNDIILHILTPSYKYNNFKYRSFNFYEKINSSEFDSTVIGRFFIFDRYFNSNLKGGLAFSVGKINSESNPNPTFLPFQLKSNFNSYGLYLTYQKSNNYLFFNFNYFTLINKENSFTGINLDIPLSSKYNSHFTQMKLEYSIKNKINLGLESINLSKTRYSTEVNNPLWQSEVFANNHNITEAYLGYNHFSEDQETFYYQTIKIHYLLNGENLKTNEIIQNQTYEYHKKLSKISLKVGSYFKPIRNKNLVMGLIGEFNRDYKKYGLIFKLGF